MKVALTPRSFYRATKRWTVTGQSGASSRRETGLQFVHGGRRRFLVFTRGALPSDRELRAMSDEVLCVLLERAEAR